MGVDLSLVNIDQGIAEIVGQAKKGYPDPGQDGYDPKKEKMVREMMGQLAFYSEDTDSPIYDPEGLYICEDCNMALKPNGCTHVSGNISMVDGGCQIWKRGEQMGKEDQLPIKISQLEANYGERPEAKGFGCFPRCQYADKAKGVDEEGRSVWCGYWGVHVMPKACCFEHSGKDLVVAPGE